MPTYNLWPRTGESLDHRLHLTGFFWLIELRCGLSLAQTLIHWSDPHSDILPGPKIFSLAAGIYAFEFFLIHSFTILMLSIPQHGS